MRLFTRILKLLLVCQVHLLRSKFFFPQMCLSIEYFIGRKNNGGTVYNDPVRAGLKIKIMTEYNIRKD